MKKLCCVVLLYVTVMSAMPWRVDDFEAGNFGDINNYDRDGDGSFWEVVPTSKSSGNYMARSESAGKTPDNLLDYPSVYVESYSFISLWVAAEGETAETYQIYIDLNGPCMPDQSRIVWEETLTSSEWKKVELDLSSHLFELSGNPYLWDANVFVGIRHYNSADQSALLIDDVMIFSRPQYLYDEGYFLIPPPVVEPYSDISMKFYVWDMSAYDYENDWAFLGYNNINLHYIITDGDGVHPEATVPLILNTDPEYPETYVLTMEGKPMGTKMEYWVEAADNTVYGFVGKSEVFDVEWGEMNFMEGFENYDSTSGWMPEGWVTFQTGETSSWDKPWQVNANGQNTHEGAYSVTSASQNSFGVWETTDYLVSPRVRINAENTYLKYFVNAQTIAGTQYKERWSVFVSTVDGPGTDIENFTEIALDSIIPTADNLNIWFEKSHYLGNYKDQHLRIMWKHHYTSTGVKLNRYLNMDDISISELPSVVILENGNAAVPDVPFRVDATATDSSGIERCVLYYTVKGQPENSILMQSAGNDSFYGYIPAQAVNTVASWYIVAEDASDYHNTFTTGSSDVVWILEEKLEWGSPGAGYTDWPEPINGGGKVAIDWNFGSKGYIYLDKIEIGLTSNGQNVIWKLVEFDGIPTNKVIGSLQGVHSFSSGGDILTIEGDSTKISGHVALVFELPTYNEVMLDESGNKSHCWQWDSVSGWRTNLWGAFYICMYVSQKRDAVLSIEKPFAGEVITKGTQYKIKWNDNIDENVKVELYNDFLFHSVIVSSTESDGSYFWSVPDDLTGEDYRVKITSVADTTVTDTNEGNFAIIPGKILVKSPNGGESLNNTEFYEIQWLDNLDERIKIELFKDDIFHSSLADSTENQSSYIWNPDSSVTGGGFKIKISSSVLPGTYYDMSDDYFTITSGAISVIKPESGSILEMYSESAIEWTDNILEDVVISLYKGTELITSFIKPSTGSCLWHFYTPSITSGNNYKVRIESSVNSELFDESGYFTIKGTNNVSGSLSGEWVDSGSPYIITGSSVVGTSNSLKLNPGVKVKGAHGDDQIDVQGRLLSHGSHSSPVKYSGIDLSFNNSSSTDSSKVIYSQFGQNEENLVYEQPKAGGTEFGDLKTKSIALSREETISSEPSESTAAKTSNTTQTIRVNNNSKVIIQNSRIENINNYGIIVDGAAPAITNNLIVNNNGGVKLVNSATFYIANNTIADNDSIGLYFDSNSDPMLLNNIVYGNGYYQVYLEDNGSDPDFYYNNIKGGSAGFGLNTGVAFNGGYEANIDFDPVFKSGSYDLEQTSPCIDGGYPDLTYADLGYLYITVKDLTGNSRLNGDIDIGCYEYHVPVAEPSVPSNVVITYGSDSVTLSWDVSANAGSYLIYTSDDPYGLFEYKATVSVNAWSTPLNSVTKKFYYIIASTENAKSGNIVSGVTKKSEKIRMPKIERILKVKKQGE